MLNVQRCQESKGYEGQSISIIYNQWSLNFFWKEMKALNLKNYAEINFVSRLNIERESYHGKKEHGILWQERNK